MSVYRAVSPALPVPITSVKRRPAILHLGQPVNIDHLLSAIYGDTTDRDIPKYGRALRDGLLFGLVDSSRFVRISDSYIDTGDDGIVIKSGALRAQAPEA